MNTLRIVTILAGLALLLGAAFAMLTCEGTLGTMQNDTCLCPSPSMEWKNTCWDTTPAMRCQELNGEVTNSNPMTFICVNGTSGVDMTDIAVNSATPHTTVTTMQNGTQLNGLWDWWVNLWVNQPMAAAVPYAMLVLGMLLLYVMRNILPIKLIILLLIVAAVAAYFLGWLK